MLGIDMSNKDKKTSTPLPVVEEAEKKKWNKQPIVRKPVFTTVRQISRYITVSGIVSEISWEQRAWPKIAEKELLTNAWDSLRVYYPPESYSKEDRFIRANVRLDNIPDNEDIRLLRIAVRNSNPDKHEVFQDLDFIFDYDKWQSTKRNQYLGTGGALGDFLKRVLGMGYASWIEGYDTATVVSQSDNNSDDRSDNYDDFSSKQWPEPLILRFSGQEYKIFIVVDSNISVGTRIEGPKSSNATNYTEVCATLPVTKSQCYNSTYYNGSSQLPLLDDLEQYFKTFRFGKRGTTSIDFVIESGEGLASRR